MGLRTAFEVPPDATVELSSGLDVGRYVAQVSGSPIFWGSAADEPLAADMFLAMLGELIYFSVGRTPA